MTLRELKVILNTLSDEEQNLNVILDADNEGTTRLLESVAVSDDEGIKSVILRSI